MFWAATVISSLCCEVRFEKASDGSFSHGSKIPIDPGKRMPPIKWKDPTFKSHFDWIDFLIVYHVHNETPTIILPAKLSKILLKPSPGESGMGVADDITWSTSNSNENGFMTAQGLFDDLGWDMFPTLLKLKFEKKSSYY